LIQNFLIAKQAITAVFEIMEFNAECLKEISVSLARNAIPVSVGKLILAMAIPKALSSIKSVAEVSNIMGQDVMRYNLPNLLPNTAFVEKKVLAQIWKLLKDAENDFHAFFEPQQEPQRNQAGHVLRRLQPQDNEPKMTPSIKEFLDNLRTMCPNSEHYHPLSIEALVQKSVADGHFSGRIEFITYQDYRTAFFFEAKARDVELQSKLGQFAAELVFVLEETEVTECAGLISNFQQFCVGVASKVQDIIEVQISDVEACESKAMQMRVAKFIKESYCKDLEPIEFPEEYQGIFKVFRGGLRDLKNDVVNLQESVALMRTDIDDLKQGMTELRNNMAELRNNMGKLLEKFGETPSKSCREAKRKAIESLSSTSASKKARKPGD
jgi:uncharacterized coiled-coil protein SlyX